MTPRALHETPQQRRPTDQRRQAQRRGLRAETLAAWWLRLKGYRILARGFRCPAGEIDLVARRGRSLAIVEVKARPSLTEAGEAVTPRQRRRIARAAEAFIQRHPRLADCAVRFDVVMIVPRRWPKHVSDAWQQG